MDTAGPTPDHVPTGEFLDQIEALQDQVNDQLDELNVRVERAIRELRRRNDADTQSEAS